MNDITAIITQEQAKISCNFDEVKQAIHKTLVEYKGAVFTEDSKIYAKKHLASLRAKKEGLQDNLREAKKEYMKPWDEFEGQAKGLIALYDEPINLINGQVRAFEENRIIRKRQIIQDIYTELVPEELKEYIPLGRIYNKKWENATVKEKEIRGEISDIAGKTAKDIETIRGMESDAVEDAVAGYRVSLDLANAVSYIKNYEKQKLKIIARNQECHRRKEEERIRREEREKVLAEQRAREEKETALRKAEKEKEEMVEQAKREATQEFIDSLIPDDGEENLYEYRISLSDDAKKKLEMYMDSIGIEWEEIS